MVGANGKVGSEMSLVEGTASVYGRSRPVGRWLKYMMGKDTMSKTRKILNIALILSILTLSGCSSGGGQAVLSSIAGEVSYVDLSGQPAVPKGVIVGVAGSGQWDTMVEATGAYKISGVPAGTYQVLIKDVGGLPPEATFWVEPASGWPLRVENRIPMVGRDFRIITLPMPPDL